MGYGYRSMSQEEKKGFTIEAQFDAEGCELTLFSGDQWHYTKYRFTFADLKTWHNTGRYSAYVDWLRSEYVRQVLKKPIVADSMSYAGVAKWCHTDSPMRDRSAIALHTFLTKWQVEG